MLNDAVSIIKGIGNLVQVEKKKKRISKKTGVVVVVVVVRVVGVVAVVAAAVVVVVVVLVVVVLGVGVVVVEVVGLTEFPNSIVHFSFHCPPFHPPNPLHDDVILIAL